MQLFRNDRMWRTHKLKSGYDVLIVGAGVHGLATAYYLGKLHGVRKVALLDKSYLGAGRQRPQYRHPAIQLPDTGGCGLLPSGFEAL